MRNVSVHNAWLNGIALSSVDASIIVRPATEDMPNASLTYMVNAGRSGRHIAKNLRESKVIRVRFSIKGLYNLSERARIIDAVNAWAYNGGVLQISSRLGQQINVTCIKYAVTGEMMRPAEVYELEFEANVCPYWEAADRTRITITGTSESGQMTIPGASPTALEVIATPATEALTSLTISVSSAIGVSTISLTGLNVAAETALTIGYDANGFLTIAAGNTSLLDKRSAASSDELLASPGTATVTVTANTAVSAEIRTRGRWL